ncbi:DUF3696 domain-containing protein [Catellatospora sp. NPDC049133]|uniref:DUF3696 domain-containing protein n=1 Tax=Catellatospora sp. NPDC049133 TaxID=3155499 RepID=UPI0033D3154B
MITGLQVRNFKRFSDLQIELRAMTVLTGVNGSGKSTLIQSLLLARHATEFNDRKFLPLNGPHGLSLGEASDVLNLDAADPYIDVVVRAGNFDFRYKFAAPDERSLNLQIVSRPEIAPAPFNEHGRRFAYLTAERLGPRDQLQVNAEDVTWLGVGEQGQYTAQILATEGSRAVRESLVHPDSSTDSSRTLRAQVERWIGEVVRPIRIDAQWPPGLSTSVIRFAEPGWRGEPIRPTNMGFGFSYTLPIVVGGLLMPPDGLLIVENPEAHLHPAGQSRLGRFLARVAGSGVQVIVETHSDHVVNGIRLGIAENRWLEHMDAVVHYFGQAAGPVSPATLEVTEKGELSSWPEGFFDQLETDLGRLARARRNGTAQSRARGEQSGFSQP